MSLKDNFNQAIKEILRKDGTARRTSPELEKMIQGSDAPETEIPAEADIDYTPDDIAAESSIAPDDSARISDADAVLKSVRPTPIPAEGLYRPGGAVESLLTRSESGFEEPGYAEDFSNMGRAPQSSYGGGVPPYGGGFTPGGRGFGATPPVSPYAGGFSGGSAAEAEETTVISRNTVVEGNIRAFANVSIEGSVKGDVRVTKDITMSGRIVGDIECNNSSFTGASMQGNIASKGQVQFDRDSMLLGDITAQYLNINGKIKGNLDIGGKAEFKADSYILGNISAATITVIDGANIQGYVNTTAFRDSTANVFPETIAIEE
ncbi:MAG: polymer-forming cytoskeletal protein [Ruminococcus sp.]|jgi:cytoskeletal protein CcmA (bactofilin family)|nr:polymer-forming cytoskeletal protein [Ruminococcus sp.]